MSTASRWRQARRHKVPFLTVFKLLSSHQTSARVSLCLPIMTRYCKTRSGMRLRRTNQSLYCYVTGLKPVWSLGRQVRLLWGSASGPVRASEAPQYIMAASLVDDVMRHVTYVLLNQQPETRYFLVSVGQVFRRLKNKKSKAGAKLGSKDTIEGTCS